MNRYSEKYRASNRGAILLLSLVFVLMLALIAGMVMQTGILQLHMAGNDRFVEEANHRAQAIVEELSLTTKNFSLEGGVGRTNCPVNTQAVDCDLRELKTPRSAQALEGVEVDYHISRVEPLMWESIPVRESQKNASSAIGFGAANFEIRVQVDGGDRRLGRANVVQGIAIRVPVLR